VRQTIPTGNHKIEFIFHPASYYTGEGISLASSILLVLALGGVLFAELKRNKPELVPEPIVAKAPAKKTK
jgi:uncharacterized membrane protein YfhO